MINMTTNKEYIVKSLTNRFEIFKVRVLEATETSYYLLNLDTSVKYRISKDEFNFKYKDIEDLGFNIPNIPLSTSNCFGISVSEKPFPKFPRPSFD